MRHTKLASNPRYYSQSGIKVEFVDRMGGFFRVSDYEGLIGEVQILPFDSHGDELHEHAVEVLEGLLHDEGFADSTPLLVLNSIDIEDDRQGEGLAKVCIREVALAQLTRLGLQEALILPDNMLEGGSIEDELRNVYAGHLRRMPNIRVIDESGHYPVVHASIDERPNPSQEWFETQRLQNDDNGYLINPDTNSIYWYHGMWPGYYDEDFYDPKESNTLYLSSCIETAKAAALANIPEEYDEENEEDEDIRAYYLVYTVKVKIPENQIFDVRKALTDETFRKLAFKMIPKDEYCNDLDIDYFKDRDNLLKLLRFGTYDYMFNEWDKSGRILVDNGFVGWIEQEFDGDECLTLALYESSSARKRVYVVEEQDYEDDR